MKARDILWLSYKDLNEKKIRTALTVLMVVIGVASIIALVSLTEGISASIGSSLNSLGPTSILVTSTQTTGFSPADIAGIEALPNVSTAIPILTASGTATIGDTSTAVTIVGIAPSDLENVLGSNVSVYQGTVYTDSLSPAALFGYTLAFPTTTSTQQVSVGEPITISVGGRNAQKYIIPVSGILNTYPTSFIPIDTGVIMSMQAAQILLHRTSFTAILVKSTNTSNVEAVSTQIGNIYGNNVRVINTQQIAATAASIIGSLTILLVVISSISLLVAAIGIMNIMLMAVIEKTHEIGIMKSIGFKSRDVMILFLSQALLVGFVGGIIGILLGVGVSYGLVFAIQHAQAPSNATTTGAGATGAGSGGFAASGGAGASGGGGAAFRSGSSTTTATSTTSSATLSFEPALTVGTIIEAMLVALIVSAIAGLYPAWRAAKMQPIEALRQL